MLKINPEWKQYNDLMNEGGEGYNPHKKWISAGKETAVTVSSTASAGQDRILKDQRGNNIRESALRANLNKDLARLEKVTDPVGRKILEASIAHAQAQLA